MIGHASVSQTQLQTRFETNRVYTFFGYKTKYQKLPPDFNQRLNYAGLHAPVAAIQKYINNTV